MTNDLLRQRRNLLITSIGLLLFDFAHLSVSKVSILGTELLVGDAAILKIFAWVMWAYFLLRYYQYLKAERVHGVKPDVHSFLYAKALGYSLKETGMTSPIGIDITNNGTRWSYSVEHGTVSIPLALSRWWTLQAYLTAAVHTPKITDHVLPFALATATAVTGLVRFVQ